VFVFWIIIDQEYLDQIATFGSQTTDVSTVAAIGDELTLKFVEEAKGLVARFGRSVAIEDAPFGFGAIDDFKGEGFVDVGTEAGREGEKVNTRV